MAELFPGFERERVRVNGVELNVVHGGKGEPVLLRKYWPSISMPRPPRKRAASLPAKAAPARLSSAT